MPTKYTPSEPTPTLELGDRKRGRPDWVPQRALYYAWARLDPIHGQGGSCYMGRPIRPDDPGYGDGWALAGFSAALEEDRAELEDVVAAYPEHAPRLRRWLQLLEGFGRLRDGDRDCSRCSKGEYYETLGALGYRSCL